MVMRWKNNETYLIIYKAYLRDLKLILSHFMTGENTIAILKKLKQLQSTRWKRMKRPRPKSNKPTWLKNPQIGPNNWKTSKVCKKTQQNLKKIVKHSSKPCSIEKWVFQSTRLKCTKRPRPKWNIPASLKNPQFGPRNWKTSKVCKKPQQNLKKILKHSNKPCSI